MQCNFSVGFFYYLMAWTYIMSEQFCKQIKLVPSRRKTADVQNSIMSICQHRPALQEHFLKHPNQFSPSKRIQQKSLTTPPNKEKILIYLSFEKDGDSVIEQNSDSVSRGECKPKTWLYWCALTLM